MSRSSKAGIGAVLALVLAFVLWARLHRSDPVFESVLAPVRTSVVAPQYAAVVDDDRSELEPSGLVVRVGSHVRVVQDGSNGVWLDDGRFVMSRIRQFTCPGEPASTPKCNESYASVLDPGTGRTGPVPGLGRLNYPDVPGEAVYRLTLTGSRPTSDVPVDVMVTYRADLTHPVRYQLPRYDGKNEAMTRNTDRRVFSIGDWDYERYSDNDGEDATESYGYLRREVGTDRWEKVLVGKRLVALWLSHDGRALLGLQQTRGEPCGGCSKAQQIVEIDPVKGVIAATYGVPKKYDKSWRVSQIDKLGGRVLVRYIHRGDVTENLGVWQYDGSWKLVKGTDGPFTWWQGTHDRIELVPPRSVQDGGYFRLVWVHGKRRTPLAGKVPAYDWAGIPGSLVPLG